MPGLPVPHHLPEFSQAHVHCIGDAIQLFHPLLPSSLSTLIFHSIRVFSSESALHIKWPKYWSFSFSISPSNEYSELTSFKIDWFNLAVQGTLKSLLQHHSSKALVLRRRSGFFMVQLSQLSMTTAAAKSLQSCPTLCDPVDGSPPGSPVPGIHQARTLEWVAISSSNA